jgi:hypothetical protein
MGTSAPNSAPTPAPAPAQHQRAPGYGLPKASTGNWLLDLISNVSIAFVHLERRFDPFFRPLFDALFREPLTLGFSALINLGRRLRGADAAMKLAEERIQPDEEAHLDDIIATMHRQMEGLWKPGGFQRGGNTKTHGIVRAEFTVRDNLPESLRRGIYATPRTYPAWVRFSGPGPYITADIDDVGFMSMSIKLMDVPGEKLMDDEKHTQDLLGVCTPTFVTADTKSNTDLQHWSLKNASIYHFVKFSGHHLLDFIMQGLWIKTQSSPLECQYFSCVPYLLGEGQAMVYSMRSRLTTRTRVPRLPLRPPQNYLREAMAATLAEQDVEFDILLQVQTDAFRMPIENNAVYWPPRLSPRIPAAVLRIPKQKFDSPAQLEFAKALSYNPWHAIPEHRPLGNQSRARLRLYKELSTYRQAMNSVQHYEPNGSETFPEG